MAFCSSFDNDIYSVAIEQNSVEHVLDDGMLVADVLLLADDCTLGCPTKKSSLIFMRAQYD
jgi:hypothetical protein